MNRGYSIEEIKEFTAKTLAIPVNKISEETSLFHDLGVDGDDAQDFLNEFSRVFGVNMSKFHYSEFFGSEGAPSPLAFIKEILMEAHYKQKKRLRVIDLFQAANTGELNL
jgi:acyl carrier protein